MFNDTKRTPPVQNVRLFATVDHGYCRTVQVQVRNAPKNHRFESITQLNAFMIIIIVFHVKNITYLRLL